MRAVTVVFDFGALDSYKRLYNVFAHSLRANSSFTLDTITPDAPTVDKRTTSHHANSHKLDIWAQYLDNATEGERIVFMDCDMMVLKDFADAFDNDFDVCYTKRTEGLPLNGGVVFIRNNAKSRAFIRRWSEVDKQMLADKDFHGQWHPIYAGINQAALGYLLETGNHEPCKITHLPCAIYNACDEDWMKLDPDCRVVHFKSELRRAVLGIRFAPWLDHVIIEWIKYENTINGRA